MMRKGLGWGAAAAAVLATCLMVFGARAAPDSAPDTYGPITATDTLWSIGNRFARGRGTTAQTAWAIYRENPEAFEGSVDRLRPGAMLKIPDAAFVKQVSTQESFARLKGKAPAKPAFVELSQLSISHPAVAGVEYNAMTPGQPGQLLSVIGKEFQPGAMLELRDLSQREPLLRKPKSVTPTRIEYLAHFPKRTSRWQVVVRNPDGERSPPYEFDGGAQVSIAPAPTAAQVVAALPPPPPPAERVAPPALQSTARFAGSADQARALEMLKEGQDADAVYQFLAPLEGMYAGEVDYDYRVGTSAFDAGRFGEAILALQRAVTTRPKFAGARMELARAYYAQGDNESARREFTTLREDNPPPEAQRVIVEYLAAIDRRAAVYEAQLAGYVDLGAGYDSNANGAPDTQTFLGFTLESRNQATSSAYYALGLGGNGSYPFAPEWRLLGNALASYRANPDASFVDSELAQVAGGIEWRPGAVTVTALPSYVHAMLDGKKNHHTLALDTSGFYAFTRSQLGVTLRYAQQRYAEVLSVEDVNTLLYGLTGETEFATALPLQLGATLSAGKDDVVETGQPFGRSLRGGRLFGRAALGRGHSVSLAFAKLDSDYEGSFFGQSRSDKQFSSTLGYEWSALRSSGWIAGAHVTYVSNSSDVLLYDYNRLDAGLDVRKEFR